MVKLESLSVPKLIKLFSCLVEHGILNAHKYKNIKKLGLYFARISLECYFSSS